MINGNDLIKWGFKPGSWFGDAIKAANENPQSAYEIVKSMEPASIVTMALRGQGEIDFHTNIHAENEHEVANIAAVIDTMSELMRVPTVRKAAVMPDACPSDPRLGYIPVGGVVATENAIHPGMHSADICCSMAISIYSKDTDPIALLDAGMRISHFGGGGRSSHWMPPDYLLYRFEENRFLKPLVSAAIEHYGTQGDGNHFFYVGRLQSTGEVALVTHHGSRKPGAMLYKAGMAEAIKMCSRLAPEVADFNSWLWADSEAGQMYWNALQIVRAWTKGNHFAIHNNVTQDKVRERFWNEHNFVFQRSDGLFYHAKGATPAYKNFAEDTNGLTLIPLNMAEPILITRGLDAAHGLGFAPHGAGRNMSRTQHMRNYGDTPVEDIIKAETNGIDARFFCGVPDVSELPSAYKSAATVRSQIEHYKLAEIVDQVNPIGNIMAGDWQKDAPWRKKRISKNVK